MNRELMDGEPLHSAEDFEPKQYLRALHLLLAGTGTGLCLGIAAAFTTEMLARPRKPTEA
jgi:F0F1-type ATP synthase membrane subunit c/vacuolar-type H+-ATPase subunit K